MSKHIIGIDLGTGQIKACYINESGKATPVSLGVHSHVMESDVYFAQNGEVIFGAEARNLTLVDPDNGVMNWKRWIGDNTVLHASSEGKDYRAKDIATLSLVHVKDKVESLLNQQVNNVAISVPANYNDRQKQDTIDAAKAAGFDCKGFADPTPALIHEPTAAMLSVVSGNDRINVEDGVRVVVDVGCGTTDISVVEKRGNAYEVKTTNGVAKLGGMDFTQGILDYCCEEFKRETGFSLTKDSGEDYIAVWEKCESVKFRLSAAEKATVVVCAEGQRKAIEITKPKARELAMPLVNKVIDCLDRTIKEAGYSKEDMLEMITIGGGSQYFPVMDAAEKFFGRNVSNNCDPLLAVAKGTAIHAWTEAGEITCQDGSVLPAKEHVLKDCTSHAIGVIALTDGHERVFSTILSKGMPIPSHYVRQFRLAHEGQTDADIVVIQGQESDQIEDCLELGDFLLEGLQPVYGKPHRIDIEMTLDKNAMLTARAVDPLDGKNNELSVRYNKAS